MSIVIKQVSPSEIDGAWEACEADIAEVLLAYLPGLITIDVCREALKQGHYQLWVAKLEGRVIGCGMSELVKFPSVLAARYFLSDYIRVWSPMMFDAIRQWAADHGAVIRIAMAPDGLAEYLGRPITTYWNFTQESPASVNPPRILAPSSERVN
jgi:hypothetical protein